MPTLRNINDEIRRVTSEINNIPPRNRTSMQLKKLNSLRNLKNNLNFKKKLFENLSRIKKENIINKQKKLWERQTTVNLYQLLGGIKSENIPENYESPITLSRPNTNLVYHVVNARTGRNNWFSPSDVRRMARLQNNYELFMKNKNFILFSHPMTRTPVKRKNISLVRRKQTYQ
jgi:hypothetical protein